MSQYRYTLNNASLLDLNNPSQSKLARQSSLTRPTKASDARSIRSIESGHSVTSHSRQPSIREAGRNLSPTVPNTQIKADPLKTQSILPTTPHLRTSLRTRKMATSASMTGLSHMTGNMLDERSTGLYMSSNSQSSRSLSSQISPRRAGLGARTVSPVELQRSKRNSNLLTAEKSMIEIPGLSRVASLRKVSGIPSPVRLLPMSRTRPSPIPPVPPIPDRLEDLEALVPQQHSYHGVYSSSARQRSATVGGSKSRMERNLQADEKTSFTSPVKQKSRRLIPTAEDTSEQLQPLDLPPLKVHSLSTPTARRVEDMSQRLQLTHSDLTRPSYNDMRQISSGNCPSRQASRTPLTVATSSSSTSIMPSTKDIEQTQLNAASANDEKSEGRLPEAPLPDSMTTTSRRRDSGGFLNRLSLSRSSSRSKAKSRKKSTDTSFDHVLITADSSTTPERNKRGLSLSWVRGKMSPFSASASSSVPRFDPGTPPTIPKSFTSDSLVSQLSIHEATSSDKAIEVIPHLYCADAPHSLMPLKANLLQSTIRMSAREIADAEMRRLIVSRKGPDYLSKTQAQLGALEARAVAVLPVEAGNIASLDGASLNLYEKGEVVDYDGKVYFTGKRDLSKMGGRLDVANSINFGYDDDRGDYLINPGDHFAYRYEIIDVLGKGSFGQVLRCIDYKTGSLVAVKVIRNKKRFHAQALVEVNILQRLRSWVRQSRSITTSQKLIVQDPEDQHHLIKYTDHFYFRHHLCIATDLLGMNLYEFLKANDFHGCTLNIIRSFTSQILSCLKMLKKQRVIHCDLKPENILLVNAWESKIKIIDFGSSCFEDQKVYTYIQSRFYRSPEVILGLSYGLPIDMWSMGCILAELHTGYPIFPGEDEQEQLGCIMELFGPPEKHLIENSTRKKLFFDSLGKPRNVVSSKGKRRKPSTRTLSQAIKCQDEAFLDFLTRCFRWNPATRLTPEDALDHPFITGLPMRNSESPVKVSRRFLSNHMTNLTPRPLPQVPRVPGSQGLRLKNNYATYRSASTAVPGNPPMLGSPSKARRVISNLPVPRERVGRLA